MLQLCCISERQLQRQTVQPVLSCTVVSACNVPRMQTSLCCDPASLPETSDPGFTLAVASLPWLPFFLTPLLCALQGSGDSPAGGSSQPVKAWRERAQQRQRFWSRTTGFQMGRSLTDWGRGKGAAEVGLALESQGPALTTNLRAQANNGEQTHRLEAGAGAQSGGSERRQG